MKTLLKISMMVLVGAGMLGSARSQTPVNQPLNANAAIRAIQQAPDPSAVVAAYASALAFAMNDPNLHQAYVARMVDLGLPEMAYHQAQTLTTLQPNNGLAWGVVAYADARRGQMPEAVSSINLAGQFAPNNRFVARTAGEIIAWYDVKADKATVSADAKAGLAQIRALLDKQTAFTDAYNTARKAYETPPTSELTPGTAAPPTTNPGAYAPQAVTPNYGTAQAYAGTPSDYYYPSYYDMGPDYYYDAGPGWIAPTPWAWWYPYGFWGGINFFPVGVTFAFGDFDDFHHFHHFGHFNDFNHFHHNGAFGHFGAFGHDPAVWHHAANGRTTFFGTPAHPASSVTWHRQGVWNGSSVAGVNSSTHWWGGGQVSRGASMAPSALGTTRAFAPATSMNHSWSTTRTAPQATFAPRSTFAAPAARAPSRFGSPAARSFGSFHSAPAFRGGMGGTMPSFSAPARSFGGLGGGGFHGSTGARSFGGGGLSGGRSVGGGFHGSGGGGGHGGGFGGGGGHR